MVSVPFMSKPKLEEASEPVNAATLPQQPSARKGSLPAPLLAVFGFVLLVGIAVGTTQHSRTASAMYDAMEACDASVLNETNGLSDAYGVVKFNYRQAEIQKMLSLCDTDPPLAREVFRTALDRRNKSAQLIALYCSFYLAGSGQLEKEDWERLTAALNPEKEKNTDVRKAAQRAIGDLIFITDTTNTAAFQAIPAGAKEAESATNRIQTHEEKLHSGTSGLNIRWSNADLAFVWIQEMSSKGQWNNNLQRFVLGK